MTIATIYTMTGCEHCATLVGLIASAGLTGDVAVVVDQGVKCGSGTPCTVISATGTCYGFPSCDETCQMAAIQAAASPTATKTSTTTPAATPKAASTSGGFPSNVSTGAVFATGAMDSAGNQWGECVYAQGAQATSNTGRVQLTSACLLNEPFAVNPTMVGSYSAMGANGFTINWTSMPSYQLEWISLCLEGGGEYQVGNWAKSTAAAPVSDTVSVSMFPMGVLLTTDSYTVSASGQTGLRTMVGASNSFDNGCAGVTDKHNVATTVADRFQYATASINVSNNDTETNEAVATVSAATSISPGIDSNQGIAFDGTYYYAFNTGSIYKYN